MATTTRTRTTRTAPRMQPYVFTGHHPEPEGARDPGFVAFWILRAGFALAPIVAGADKFLDWMTEWPIYLWTGFDSLMPGTAQQFMYGVGVVEIMAGLLVLFAPRVGALVLAGWLAGIVFNLVAASLDDAFEFWDIALRDFGLMLGALALFTLARKYGPRARYPATR